MPRTEWTPVQPDHEGFELEQLQQEHNKLEDSYDELKAEYKDMIEQRNMLVAWLARIYPAGKIKTNIEGWNPEWHGCCYIDTPHGQISYHYHDSQEPLFAALPNYGGLYDGHTKEDVHNRVKDHFGKFGLVATDMFSGKEILDRIMAWVNKFPSFQDISKSDFESFFLRQVIGRRWGRDPKDI